jgi:tetratricopeptide (TPR) repeat protein
MVVVAAIVLAQVAGSSAGAFSGYRAGPRPAECAGLQGRGASNVWERAKSPALRRYCDLLASGAAKLASPVSSHGPNDADGASEANDDAREAIALADEASSALPGRAAPDVLRGRALARLGRWADAAAALERAQGLDPHALDDPAALLVWARALGRAGRFDEAEGAYHALLPRSLALVPAEHGRAELEAALLAERRGEAGADEAIALLRQARRDAQDALQALAGLALALALDREGEKDESRSVLGMTRSGDPRAIVEDARAVAVLETTGDVAESDALAAIGLGDRDAASARALWSKYLAGQGGKGPWADAARAHVRPGQTGQAGHAGHAGKGAR